MKHAAPIPFARVSIEPHAVRRAILVSLAVLAPALQAALFLSRANQNYQVGMDFRLTYTAAVAWTQGENPYDDATLKETWRHCGMPQATPPGWPQTPNVYPLTIAPILSPLAMLSFPDALALWMGLNAACVTILLLQLLNAPTADWRLAAAAAGIFMFCFPLRYGLLFGNLAVLTTFLLVQTLRMSDRPIVAGLLLGLALIKYTLCAPIALYLLVQGRWRTVAVAAGVQVGLFLLATYAGGFSHPGEWIGPMMETAHRSMEPGQANHHAALAYTALHLELPALLYRISPMLDGLRHLAVGGLVLSLVGGLLQSHRGQKHVDRVGPDRAASRTTTTEKITIEYVAILAVTLLAFYHRTYDLIVVLAPLLAWLLAWGDQISRGLRAGLWIAAICSVFPGATFHGGDVDVSWFYLAIVQPVATWAVLGIACLAIGHLLCRSRQADIA